MKRVKTEPVSCYGVNHADFSPDGRYFIVSCEFSGELLKVDTERMKVIGQQKLPFHGAMPQDVKISPDGKKFYIADMMADGVWVLDGDKFTQPTLLHTGKGTHGLYVSRDSREMYISNRGEGTISIFDFTQDRLTKKWRLPTGAAPTWAASRRTARFCGSPAATTRRCTPSTPAPASSSPVSPSAAVPTASPCTPSPAATRSATPASSARTEPVECHG